MVEPQIPSDVGPCPCNLAVPLEGRDEPLAECKKRLQHRLDPGSGWTELSADSRAKGRVCIED
jgi:hypothetical protein